MKTSLLKKLHQLTERHQELGALLADAEVINDQERFRACSMEYAELEPVARGYANLRQLQTDIETATQLAEDSDTEIRELAREELGCTQKSLEAAERHLQQLLLPKDPSDAGNVFLEVRAGTGGNEAALFAGELLRMYARHAERRGWKMEILSGRPGEYGGYKEVICRISGRDVYRCLKFESGAHRVQRVPETESQGRIHTSTCTVAVLPEAADVAAIEVNRADLRVDTFRASGVGGQHVNKTDSAVRLTHLPSGIVVECQDERSQHQNRARAMSLLQAKLLDQARQSRQRQQADMRRNLIGSGDRSERIRTYNFPQGRITDHRINLTLYGLEEFMAGHLDQILEPLQGEHQADLLAALETAG